jgi:predicted metal-dependent phosphoesterase TrpH
MPEQQRGPIDLHTHSSVSDGTETPAELVAQAARQGLSAVALTDHDSTAGWADASAAALAHGITLVPGMEMSTQLEYASVHVLAYLFDPEDADLAAMTARVRGERMTRAEAMVGRIGRDYALTWDDVLAQTTPGSTIGRPHIAARSWRAATSRPARPRSRASSTGRAATTGRTTRRTRSSASS